MDYNEDRQIKTNKNVQIQQEKSLAKSMIESNENQNAFIYLNSVGNTPFEKTNLVGSLKCQLLTLYSQQRFQSVSIYYMCLEPIKLIGEGEYNLDTLKEIEVTESYLGLDQYVRECQEKESS